MPGAKSLPRPARRLSAPTGPDRADRVTHNIDIGTDGASRAVPIDIQELLATRLLVRSEEHTSELQSLMRTSYAVFCLTQQRTPPRYARKFHLPTTTRHNTT